MGLLQDHMLLVSKLAGQVYRLELHRQVVGQHRHSADWNLEDECE
jgi:hypothetical protein